MKPFIKIIEKIFIVIILLFYLNCQKSIEQSTQQQNNEVSNQKKISGCGFTKLIEIEKKFLPAEERVKQIIDNIISYSGLPNNFEIYRADYIDNAFATIVDERRIIVYDSKLFNDVEWYSDTFWTSVSILAHEIGHHLSGHTQNNLGSNHTSELEADKFSGFVLYKMGASLEQSIKAMTLISSEYDSKTHPSKDKRVTAIQNGWEESSKLRYLGALPPVPFGNDKDFFYTFTKEMLINREYLQLDESGIWYGEYDYQKGIITEVDSDFTFFKIRILEPSEYVLKTFKGSLDDDWIIYLDEIYFGGNSEMCHACELNLKHLIKQGRRVKFAYTEGFPGAGTIYNGSLSLTYCEVLKSDYFK